MKATVKTKLISLISEASDFESLKSLLFAFMEEGGAPGPDQRSPGGYLDRVRESQVLQDQMQHKVRRLSLLLANPSRPRSCKGTKSKKPIKEPKEARRLRVPKGPQSHTWPRDPRGNNPEKQGRRPPLLQLGPG